MRLVASRVMKLSTVVSVSVAVAAFAAVTDTLVDAVTVAACAAVTVMTS